MSPVDLIAEVEVLLAHPDGRRAPGKIWVARPERVSDREAVCSIGVDGLQALRPIHGSDCLQAMLLALRLAAGTIGDFMAKGGQLLYPDGSGPMDLEPYFGSLVSARAAFTDLQWLRLDVRGVVSSAGLAVVRPADRKRCTAWFVSEGYSSFTIDCASGKKDVLRQVGQHLKWREQFGYDFEDGEGNLDALNDGFDFEIPASGRFVLELSEPEVLWREDARWFEGLLSIASDHSRRHLALGHRFFTVLWADDTSPLLGLVVEKVAVPYPWTPPPRPTQA